MKTIKKFLISIYFIILDFLFPKTEQQKTVENLSVERILEQAPKADSIDDEIFPLWSYGNKMIRDLIWELKYRGNNKAADLIAEMMCDNILAELVDMATFENFSEPTLIPIPLSKQRLKERGFNQTEILAKKIAEIGKDFPLKCLTGVLIKIKNTASQTKSAGRKERLQNLHDCFAVSNPALIRGKNLILIDDVTTTGATLAEAKKTLKKSGARRVIAFTVAH
jgi:ComF family protein